MKSKSTKKNFIYNLIYQMLLLIIPLITAPYLSRVVGADGVGIYSYTYSVAYYFMLFCMLGVNNYGNRSVAKVRDDKEKLSHTFWNIYFLQLIMGMIMILIYVFYIFAFNIEYKSIALIQLLFILSATLDINWLYFGLEEFKLTITRNSILKIGTIILIFLFVKNSNDLWKYTLIMSGMTLISQIVMWLFVKKRIKYSNVSILEIKKHIKPNLILFIPVIAVSLYKMMDKVMLGAISSVIEVGYYEQAEKISNIPLTIITALGTVMLPRISNIISKGDNKKVGEYIRKSISFVMFMSYAMCFGLIAVGYDFAPVFLGSEFQKSGIIIMLLATTLPFISFANVLRTQYLIPSEKDNVYIKSVIMGAITNLILNAIFIPKYASIGACIGTICAEIVVMLYQTISVRKELPIKLYIKGSTSFLIKSIIMFICIYPLNFLNINVIIKIILKIIVGSIVYCLLNIKYIFEIISINKIINKIKRKFDNN